MGGYMEKSVRLPKEAMKEVDDKLVKIMRNHSSVLDFEKYEGDKRKAEGYAEEKTEKLAEEIGEKGPSALADRKSKEELVKEQKAEKAKEEEQTNTKTKTHHEINMGKVAKGIAAGWFISEGIAVSIYTLSMFTSSPLSFAMGLTLEAVFAAVGAAVGGGVMALVESRKAKTAEVQN